MKKIIKILLLTLLTVAFLSCGEKIDTSVWLNNYEDAKKAASSESKLIFALFSELEADGKSAKLKENLFDTEDFIKTYTEKYVLLNLDYSNSRTENDSENLSKDMRIFESYDVKEIPYFLVLSPEGYVITRLAFEENADLDYARITFSEAEETIRHFQEILARTKSGTDEERLSAIDEIFDLTDPGDTYHLRPLSKLYLSLDKKNKTGNYTKHAISLTYAKVQDYLMDGEEEKGCEEFVKLAKDKNLSPDDKQMAYYTAGYVLVSSRSENFKKMMEYFQMAYDVNPESEAAQTIKMAIDYVQMMIDGEGDYAPQQKEESAEQSENPAAESDQVNEEGQNHDGE